MRGINAAAFRADNFVCSDVVCDKDVKTKNGTKPWYVIFLFDDHEFSLLTLLLLMMVTVTVLMSILVAEEVSTLFRGTSLTTTLMDQYMKMVAIPYLQKTIGDVVAKILECKQSCEV